MNWKLVVIIGLWGWIMCWQKSQLEMALNRSLPPVEAGLLRGILWGSKDGLAKIDKDDLRRSGLIHLVVASGGNIMLVVGGLIEGISGWMGRKKAIVIGVSLGWKYVVLAGWEIPVVRAMLLMSVVYLAQLLGRKYCLWRGVLGSSLVMILGEPRVLLSVSFWLSLTAFMGIATKKLVINKFELKIKNKLFKNIFDSFFETVWIMIWITPILALVFGEISWIAPMANILVIGLVQIVTVWGMVGSMGGMLFEELGRWMLWLTIPILRYLMYISRLTGSFQGWKISFNWWMVAGYYLILICLLWRKNNEKQQI